MGEQELQSQSVDIANQSTELVVFSKEDGIIANGMLKSIKSAQKAVNDFFDPMVEAAYKTHKEITNKRKSFLDPLAKAEARVKGKLSAYITKVREEERKVEIKLQEQAKQEGLSVVVNVDKEETPAGLITKERFEAEVVDFKLLPDKYKLANMQMLNALARAEKDNAKVPGVKFIKKLAVETRI